MSRERASRRGRGRLSSIEALPEHAEPAVQRALEALSARRLPQSQILAQLNFDLAALDPPVDPISKSAFNRHSIRFAAQARRLMEAREAAAAMAERLSDMPEGDVGLLLGETIKSLIYDVMIDGQLNGESVSIKQLQAAADALHRLERARRDNAETARLAQQHLAKRIEEAVDQAVGGKGLSEETVQALRAAAMGVRRG